jgi:TrmH family RNA methyltransferase
MISRPVTSTPPSPPPAHDASLALARVRVVLVRPEHPGNIGSVARAMANMGLSDLHLVAPREFPSLTATAMAAGADHLLSGAHVVAQLDDALAGCSWVVGATARARAHRVEQRAPEEAMAELLQPQHARVALLFGSESRGLDNDALERCQRVTRIPVDAAFSSLNLAAAVTVLCYELRRQATAQSPSPVSELVPRERRPATADELRHLIDHLRAVVDQRSETPTRAASVMKRLARLLHRAAPDHGDVQLLRGLLTETLNANARG